LESSGAGEARAWAGAIRWHLRDAAGAHREFEFVKGAVKGCTPFRAAEMEAIAMCGLDKPEDAAQHLRAALRRRHPIERAAPNPIYDLLTDPLLPGIDRLRTMVDSKT
jgi:hypothetical protein